MSNSLREQLLGLGFKPASKPERKPDGSARARGLHAGAGAASPRSPRPALSQDEIDLAKAYALRAQREKCERLEAERVKQEQARLRREAKAALAQLLHGKSLNDPGADIARHFEYGGKIKRVHVTAEQLRALNAGELGVVQLQGRYLLVAAGVLADAAAVFPEAVALKVDPDASAQDDPYADPRFRVPDDLVW